MVENWQNFVFDLFGQKEVKCWAKEVKKRSKTDKIPFSAVYWPKRGQMLFDFNFETTYEILSSFPAYMTPFC